MKKFKITVDGKEYSVLVEEVKEKSPSPVAPAPTSAPVPSAPPQTQKPQAPAGDGNLSAPMPGTILQILVKEGDQVQRGQALLILEAMKMENGINATVSGTVANIAVSVGQSVDTGQLLMTIR